jgi:hypothetical protein
LDPRHWLHVPHKPLLWITLAIGILLVALAAVSQMNQWRPAAPMPVPAPVVQTNLAVSPAVKAEAPAVVKGRVVTIKEPIIIYGKIPR